MYVGQRLSFSGSLCTVRYIGEIKGTKGQWLGVEWDDPSRGKHDGEVGGVRYFNCSSKEATAASFVRPNRPPDEPRTFLGALRFKYASEHTKISFQIGGPPPVEKAIKISGKVVEEVGFEKIRKQLAELHELRIVLLDGLCIRRPVHEDTRRAWREYNGTKRPPRETDIYDVCPKIVELDLSRNLFEDWSEVVSICEQLPNLRSLRVDGNRFKGIIISGGERPYYQSVFSVIKNMSLENTLMTWRETVGICSLFQTPQSLVLSKNYFSTVDPSVSLDVLSQSVTSIDLESNDFHSLSDIAPLATLTNLQTLILKNNAIAKSTKTPSISGPIFPPNVTTLDLSHNAIDTWSIINSLHIQFPGLTSLRIAHNPLFNHLQGPDHRTLSTDDGYMLTIARLPNLKSLNYSTVSAKDRLNAESYYLSLIATELSLAPETATEEIKAKHPQYAALCAEYGEPEIRRQANRINPNSLAARLVTLKFKLSPEAQVLVGTNRETAQCSTSFEKEIPKSLSIYSVLGIVGKHFKITPMQINLIYETTEWDAINRTTGVTEDGPWDSEDESDDGNDGADREWVNSVRREVQIVAGTRSIGSWIEGAEADIRVELRERRRIGYDSGHK